MFVWVSACLTEQISTAILSKIFKPEFKPELLLDFGDLLKFDICINEDKKKHFTASDFRKMVMSKG